MSTIDSIRLSSPVEYMWIENPDDIIAHEWDDLDTSLFMITTKPQQVRICCEGVCHAVPRDPISPEQHHMRLAAGCTGEDLILSDAPITVHADELNVSSMIAYLERYFLWFGVINTVFFLGTTAVVFRMEPWAVKHILESPEYDISIASALVLKSGVYTAVTDDVSIRFTTRRIGANFARLIGESRPLEYVARISVVSGRLLGRRLDDGPSIKAFFEEESQQMPWLIPLTQEKDDHVFSNSSTDVCDSVEAKVFKRCVNAEPTGLSMGIPTCVL